MNIEGLMQWILAVAAVGTAAMGLVEAAKFLKIPGTRLSLANVGLGKAEHHLGDEALAALKMIYGADQGRLAGFEAISKRLRPPRGPWLLLEGAWRKGAQAFGDTVRNGLRMAVFADNGTQPLPERDQLVTKLGQDWRKIAAAVSKLRSAGTAAAAGGASAGAASAGAAVPDMSAEREHIARLEAALDARVDAAVAAGRDKYTSSMQLVASIVAIVGCLIVERYEPSISRAQAVLVGVIAVPVAPVAKDLVSFLSSLRTSFAKARGAA